jgi:hypothetical protein
VKRRGAATGAPSGECVGQQFGNDSSHRTTFPLVDCPYFTKDRIGDINRGAHDV